jgi:hypothetical protein
MPGRCGGKEKNCRKQRAVFKLLNSCAITTKSDAMRRGTKKTEGERKSAKTCDEDAACICNVTIQRQCRH